MKFFKQILNEVMSPSETIPFKVHVSKSESDPTFTSTGYYSTFPGKDRTHRVSTFIDTWRDDHTIGFVSDGMSDRPESVPSDHAHALKVYSTVLAHMKHYIKNNPTVKNFSFLSNNPDKSRLYMRLARKFGVGMMDLNNIRDSQ